jgi:hypothetical protein
MLLVASFHYIQVTLEVLDTEGCWNGCGVVFHDNLSSTAHVKSFGFHSSTSRIRFDKLDIVLNDRVIIRGACFEGNCNRDSYDPSRYECESDHQISAMPV